MTVTSKKLYLHLSKKQNIKISPRKSSFIKKAVIEKFLPRFANDARVIFIANTLNRNLFTNEEEIKKLGFIESLHKELPDIIAYSKKKNWLYLIETVHSYGTMNEERVFELEKMFKNCNAHLIFITAFATREDFKKWCMDIAWETEIWTADNPDHVAHFNGDKFFGPYKS
jgi:BsuBI/PstI restriction endonuclease domain